MCTGLGPLSRARLDHLGFVSDLRPPVPLACVHTRSGGMVSSAEEGLSYRGYSSLRALLSLSRANLYQLGLDEPGLYLNQYTGLFKREVVWKIWWWDRFKVLLLEQSQLESLESQWDRARNEQGKLLIWFLVGMLCRPELKWDISLSSSEARI